MQDKVPIIFSKDDFLITISVKGRTYTVTYEQIIEMRNRIRMRNIVIDELRSEEE